MAKPALGGATARAKILLVDDRPENLLSLEAVLEPLELDCYRASSGLEALKWLLKEEFALMMLDAKMPSMDGFETARIIRQRQKTRHLPIIFVTGNDPNQIMVLEGYSVGAADYITKPFNPEILRSKVRVFVELWRRGEQIKNQQEQLHRSAILEAERREREEAMRKVQEQVLALNSVLESRVTERTAQLVQANEEMEAFCYSVSHDLRTPLRGVIATSRILIEEAKERLTPDELELLERQSRAAKRLGELIDDLLQLSRLGRKTLEKQDLDVSELARSVAEETLAMGWQAEIEIKVEPGMRCYADLGLTRLLLQNLLENACKYSPEGGTIYVGSIVEDGVPVLFVRDEGIGFSMEYRHKVFLPFERLVLDSEVPGTGIGLANAKRIVNRHGGKIWVESVPRKGSTFFFTL
jgi:signal transduction histidine kinase